MKTFIVLSLLFSLTQSAQATQQVRWYATNEAVNKSGNALNLGEDTQKIDITGGWSCVVGPISTHLPQYEVRETTCRNGEKIISFSVQCEPKRNKDHTQIRFKDTSERTVGFIEVGCEFRQ